MEMYVVRCELENLHVDQNTVWGAKIFVTMRNMTDIPIEVLDSNYVIMAVNKVMVPTHQNNKRK